MPKGKPKAFSDEPLACSHEGCKHKVKPGSPNQRAYWLKVHEDTHTPTTAQEAVEAHQKIGEALGTPVEPDAPVETPVVPEPVSEPAPAAVVQPRQMIPQVIEPVADDPAEREPIALAFPIDQTIWIGNRNRPSRAGTSGVQRTVKMLRPMCTPATMMAQGLDPDRACQNPENYTPGWWERCRHSPYVSKRQQTDVEMEFSEPDEQGRRQKIGEREIVWFEDDPNLEQVTLSKRVSSGLAVNDALAKGFRFPDPPFCQLRECWSQNIRVHTRYGDYCSELHAKLVGADVRGVRLETHNEEKRASQLEEVAV